jgi:hypothetical protein
VISLSAPTFDIAGHLVLKAHAQTPFSAERRGSVTATLDGESAVYDTGYSVSDTTLVVSYRHPTPAQITTLHYLVSHYPALTLSCVSGCYSARASFTVRGSTLSLQLRLLSRLDA